MPLPSAPQSIWRKPGPLAPDNSFPSPTGMASSPFGTSSLQQPLPTPPPSIKKKVTIWDKDHLSETLAGISQAFLSNQNFGEGLGAAAGSLAQGNQTLRKRAEKATTFGGPDNRFEITTDGEGNRTVREVPEFAKVAREEREAKAAPKPSELRDVRSRALYGILQLPPEQRPAAYAELRSNPAQYGVDLTGMPSVWNDTYGTIAGNMGMTVPQARSQDRGDKLGDSRIKRDAAAIEQGAQRVELSREAGARAALKGSSPPSTRRGGSSAKPVKGYSIITSAAAYRGLPSGSKYIAPDGSKRIKP